MSVLLEVDVPVYEYWCRECKRRVSVFWRSFSEADAGTATCPRCNGTDLVRQVSRVRVIRSEGSRLDDLSDFGDLPDFDENDPKAMGRWMRKMSDEIDDDLGPEFDEVVGRLEAGEDPEKIEESIPDLMGDGDPVANDDFGF
jgi:putative FmdB family regulatory protein